MRFRQCISIWLVVFAAAFFAPLTQAAQAQTFTVLHSFTGGGDGATPYAGVTMDRAGNLYGTTSLGGIGHGAVYKLRNQGSNWLLSPLYSFAGGSDGAGPTARVNFGPDGLLYGTTMVGGEHGAGTVFRLAPPARACNRAICPWTETLVHVFDTGDGAFPGYGDLIFDQTGNLYGTTYAGGEHGVGVAYELMPSNGGWTENRIYDFSGADGAAPFAGLIFDQTGNLYGTTYSGGQFSSGTIFNLTRSSQGWTESVLHSFGSSFDGAYPYAGLMSDLSGNLYGATSDFAPGGGGLVFELSPSGGSWAFLNVYNLTGVAFNRCGPWGNLATDSAGNLYGTTFCDGSNHLGSVFKLTFSGGRWIYTSLHDFTGGDDGANPASNVTRDASGKLYGTASAGGALGYGVVWEITP